MKTNFRKMNIFVSALLFIALALGLAMPLTGAQATGTTVLVDNLQPSWTALGGGGVFSAYIGPTAYGYVSPGSTALYDGREAGIIKAGIYADPTYFDYEDEGLFGFKPTVTINNLASGPLTYDVETQAGVNPVWMTIEIDTGLTGESNRGDDTIFQFVPTTNPAGWHTVDAAAGLWQKWNNNNGDVTGNPLVSLGAIASDPAYTGLNIIRAYLRLGMGNSYFNGGTGTIAWVDQATLGGVTYDFILAKYWYVAKTGLDTNEGTLASPFLTISHAITAAAPDDTIHVAAGTYNEVVTVNNSLTLDGAQAGVDARGRTGSETILPAQAGGSSAISISANNVTIDGFTIQGAGTAGLQTWGINAAAGTATSNVHITNNIFQNLFEGLHVQGPNTNVSSHMTVDKNSFFDDPSDAFAKDAGIWMASAPSDNLTITNNSFSGHDACNGGDFAAINIDFSTDLVISNNTGHNDGSFLVLVNDTNVTVSGNNISNSSTPSCYMESSVIFLGLGNNGVTIQNNSLDHGYRGVRLSTAFGTGLNQNIQVLNNTITHMVDAGILVPVGTVSDPVIVHGNQIIGNLIGIQNDNTTPVVDATGNWWGAASGPGPVGPGTGDPVSANVNFSPWCVNDICAGNPPPAPSNFWGRIYTTAGSPAVGMKVDAFIGTLGNIASATIVADGSDLGYLIDVPGDIVGTIPVEGGVEGNPITFKINDLIVGTGYWHSGTNVQLNFAGVALSNLSQVYDGTAKHATVTTNPPGLSYTVTYNGSASEPTNAGNYTVVATVTTAYYQGSATGTLTITPATATITLSNLVQNYDGTPKHPTVVTVPAGLSYSVTYNGSSTEPSAAGAYALVVTITDPNGNGSTTGTMYIQTTCTTSLVTGWNLVSLCLAPVNTAPGTVLSSLGTKYDLVYGWDGSISTNNWLKYAPSVPYGNNLVKLDHKMGFWIHMKQAATLTATGYPPSATDISVYSTAPGGWNLLGFPKANGTLLTTPLPTIMSANGLANFTLVYAYHAFDTDQWKLYDNTPGVPGFANDLKFMEPAWGYWVQATGAMQTWHVAY